MVICNIAIFVATISQEMCRLSNDFCVPPVTITLSMIILDLSEEIMFHIYILGIAIKTGYNATLIKTTTSFCSELRLCLSVCFETA